MKQEYYFKNAKWLGNKNSSAKDFAVLRGHFTVKGTLKASLAVLGLGFFKVYINGHCLNPDTFLPLSSDYEKSCDPANETLAGHRVYVPEFDITPYVKDGDNVIAVHYGGGWYCHTNRIFGVPKAIYRIRIQTEQGETEFVSDTHCRIGKGYMEEYNFVCLEKQNYKDWNPCFDAGFDDSGWEHAVLMEPLDTEYCSTDCPTDAWVETLSPKKVGNGKVYDCGENTTGYPVLKVFGKKGDCVTVHFSEELSADGEIDWDHSYGQTYEIVCDGKERVVQPEFTWYGFRCFKIEGDAEPECVKVIHADIPVTSTFTSDNETLNWIYKTFVHTMLCNMHTGHPSDCPHIERRGYTGDGQLTCHATLSCLGARTFYEKWMQDIADSQDLLSGHIQYTAPYICSGGGPGGWGSAIVEVPYQLYKHYGDEKILEKYYHNMQRYIDYLEAHSEFGLVTSDKEGEWCLGDWCGPVILYPDKGITSFEQQVMLPAPMVNTYFMVRSLQKMCKIARIIGKEEDIEAYEEKINLRKRAIQAAYYNTFDGNFIMNMQGANAFAVDLGIGGEQTYQNMVDYYKKVGCFDTGIFATDVLIRVLFENGDADLAWEILTNPGAQGYEHWRQNGATTFHEYWDSNRSRSHNHPMFGAPVAYLFEYLLGIRQTEESAGYRSLVISPQMVPKMKKISGSMEGPAGIISVSYENTSGRCCFQITIPADTKGVFQYKGQEYCLKEGENQFCF